MINEIYLYGGDQNFISYYFCNFYVYKEVFVFYGILYFIVVIFIVVINILVVGVFLKQKMKFFIIILLIGFVIGDVGVGVVIFFLYIYYYSFQNYRFILEYLGCIFYYVVFVIFIIFYIVFVWVIMVLGVQCYLVVLYLFKGFKYCIIRVLVIVFVYIYVFVIVMYFFQFFYLNYREIVVNGGNGIVYQVCECWVMDVLVVYEGKFKIFKFFLVKLIFCIILVIIIIFLVRKFDKEV